MSKATNKFELMSTKDICGQLCISSRTLERYRKRAPNENPFPEPDCAYMGGPNKWLRTKVTAWQIKEMSRSTRKPMSHLNLTGPLQYAVDAGKATEEEAAALIAWQDYRLNLMRVNTSKAPDIKWPELSV